MANGFRRGGRCGSMRARPGIDAAGCHAEIGRLLDDVGTGRKGQCQTDCCQYTCHNPFPLSARRVRCKSSAQVLQARRRSARLPPHCRVARGLPRDRCPASWRPLSEPQLNGRCNPRAHLQHQIPNSIVVRRELSQKLIFCSNPDQAGKNVSKRDADTARSNEACHSIANKKPRDLPVFLRLGTILAARHAGCAGSADESKVLVKRDREHRAMQG